MRSPSKGPPLPPAAAVVALFSWCKGFPWLSRAPAAPLATKFSSQLNRLSFLGDFGGNGFLLALIWRNGNSLRRKLLKVFLLTQTIFIPQVITYEGMQGSSHFALDDF